MKRFGLLKTVCIICLVCATAATASLAQPFTTLHSFGDPDGSTPYAGLVQATDGNFYGTTYFGGVSNRGTVFKITSGGVLTTLYSFCAQSDCPGGEYPIRGLVQATDGNFYGTTILGGTYGQGAVFRITPEGVLTTLYSFCAQNHCSDGSGGGASGLVQATDGNLYGATWDGGEFGLGTVFKITLEGVLTTVYSFCAPDGCPYGARPKGLVQAIDGNFYGETSAGGNSDQFCNNGCGTIFKLTPDGVLATLYKFCAQTGCPDGATPTGLVQASDGNFYGTTTQGGAGVNINCYGGCGTIFKITPAGVLTTLHSFCVETGCPDGYGPEAGLVQAADGNFYGSTAYVGTGKYGTIFEITPQAMLTTLYRFHGSDGIQPNPGLMQARDGNFYGTTYFGGPNSNCLYGTFGCGTIFTFGPQSVKLWPTPLIFRNAVINTTSPARVVTLTNSGTALLTISDVTISGNFDVSANTCTGATLTMGMRCRVNVTFTPPTLGNLTGTLTFTDNAGNNPQTMLLSGSVVEPATLTPTSATYAPQALGTTSAAKTFTLFNRQWTMLENIAISTTGDFAVSATTCTPSLPAMGKCTISVTFTPTTTGTRSGMLGVSDGASNSPQNSTLTGKGK